MDLVSMLNKKYLKEFGDMKLNDIELLTDMILTMLNKKEETNTN